MDDTIKSTLYFQCLMKIVGGRGGIRTHGTLAGTPVFKTGALNHSATLPSLEFRDLAETSQGRKRRLPPDCSRSVGVSQATERRLSHSRVLAQLPVFISRCLS